MDMFYFDEDPISVIQSPRGNAPFQSKTTKLKLKLWLEMLRLNEAEAEAASYPCLSDPRSNIAVVVPVFA